MGIIAAERKEGEERRERGREKNGEEERRHG